MRTRRTTIKARAKSDGLRLLRTINHTQAHGEEGHGRTQPERRTKRAWISAPSVAKMPWRTSWSRPHC